MWKKENPQGFALAHMRRKLIRPGARGKCPKENCDGRVHLMLVAHADSLGFFLNPRVAFVVQILLGSTHVIKFQRDRQILGITL